MRRRRGSSRSSTYRPEFRLSAEQQEWLDDVVRDWREHTHRPISPGRVLGAVLRHLLEQHLQSLGTEGDSSP